MTLAELLEGEGHNEKALEYVAYWYAVDITDLAGCSYGMGSAAFGRPDAS